MQETISWRDVKRTVAAARWCALAVVTEDGVTRVTPIGTVFLTGEGRGFYFEDDPALIPGNLERAEGLAIVAVAGTRESCLGRLMGHGLPCPGALRLKVHAGRRRLATGPDHALWRALTRPGAWLRCRLKRGMRFVREFTVEGVAPIHLGAMGK